MYLLVSFNFDEQFRWKLNELKDICSFKNRNVSLVRLSLDLGLGGLAENIFQKKLGPLNIFEYHCNIIMFDWTILMAI